ncbi:MAG: type II toxin-antitoxin system HipA family toxin [Deltaproteobacteria bacterium]|nr:type II toxin-antitoxin system HipA family toxin [Deltaproteobacteria bacterium]
MNAGSKPALFVFWDVEQAPIGELTRQADGATSFRYLPGAGARRPISHSLPLDDGEREHPGTFFENLLPDGIQRERLARRLGVSDASTFAMLEVVGGDCAGALTVARWPLAVRARATPRPLDEALLRKLLETGVVPTVVSEGLRLSLAGAQDKLPVVLRDGTLALPEGRAASTHILKLPNRDFPGLVDNEHFLLELARDAGLPVVRSVRWPLPAAGRERFGLLVERFDRAGGRRLHQEDLCQATGMPPSRKYQADSGPSLLDVVAVLDAASTEPRDIAQLVRWQAFNVATGNNDGHAKNLSLRREPAVCLAPAYDLVCTRAWDSLSKDLAFGVAEVRDGGAVGPVAWSRFAEEARVGRRLVLDAVAQVTTAVAERATAVANAVIEAGADERAVSRALECVRRCARRALRLAELERPPVRAPARRRPKRATR